MLIAFGWYEIYLLSCYHVCCLCDDDSSLYANMILCVYTMGWWDVMICLDVCCYDLWDDMCGMRCLGEW